MKKLLLIMMAAQLCACASMFKTHDKNNAAVEKIHNVAIVGFTHDLPASAMISLDGNSGTVGAAAGGGSGITEESPEAKELFEKVIASFEKQLKWNVMASRTMLAMPQYTAAYKATMEGWQNKMSVGEGFRRFNVPGVMDSDGMRILEKSGREKLMDDLHVDALVSISSRVVLNGTTIMGFGSRRPQTRITFFVYTRDLDAPVWFETLAGAEMESVGKTAFINEAKMSKLALKSADSALEKLGKEVN